MKNLKLVQLFSDPGKFDRTTGDSAKRKSRSASGIAIVTYKAESAKSPKAATAAVELPLKLTEGVKVIAANVSRKDLVASALAKYSRARKTGQVKAASQDRVKSGSRKDRAKALRA